MVLPPFIVKGGFFLASILFRVLAGSHWRSLLLRRECLWGCLTAPRQGLNGMD